MLSSSVSVAPFAGYSGGVVLSSSASPMATLDSVAVFEARAIEIGVLPLELDVLRRKGWNTLGRFAFACGYSPGGPDESRLLRLAATMTGAGAEEPSDERMPVIRHLYFEAYTMAASELRSRIESREDDKPRRLANVGVPRGMTCKSSGSVASIWW